MSDDTPYIDIEEVKRNEYDEGYEAGYKDGQRKILKQLGFAFQCIMTSIIDKEGLYDK